MQRHLGCSSETANNIGKLEHTHLIYLQHNATFE